MVSAALLAIFGVSYFAIAVALRVDEVSDLVRRQILRRLRIS
jgi:hypothetical protein